MIQLPDQEMLHMLFEYSFIEGALYWRKRLSPMCSLSKPAGFTDREGYKIITIKGKAYRRHRLIWVYFNEDPRELEIDHKNRVKGDDRIENLRLATREENSRNVLYASNKSGHPGVCWHKRDKRWRVGLRVGGVNHHVGYFADLEKARAAHREASLRMHGQYSVLHPETRQ